jgi:HAMP domain-containing protein
MAACFYFIEGRFMNSNEVEVSIENAWVEFERVGEISHSNADNLLTAVTNIKANHDRMADEIAELREAINEMINYKGILTSDNPAIINAKKLLNK